MPILFANGLHLIKREMKGRKLEEWKRGKKTKTGSSKKKKKDCNAGEIGKRKDNMS